MTVFWFRSVLSRQQREYPNDQIHNAPSGVTATREQNKGVLGEHLNISEQRSCIRADPPRLQGFDKALCGDLKGCES